MLWHLWSSKCSFLLLSWPWIYPKTLSSSRKTTQCPCRWFCVWAVGNTMASILLRPCQLITQFPVARGSPLLSHPRHPPYLPPRARTHTHTYTHTCSGETWQDSRCKEFSSLTTALLSQSVLGGDIPIKLHPPQKPRVYSRAPLPCKAVVVAWCTQAPCQVRMFS